MNKSMIPVDPPPICDEFSFNFISIEHEYGDESLFFASNDPSDVPIVFKFDSHEKMAHIVAKCGLFSSVTQAKKNGWNFDIPDGFNCFVVGKKKLQIWILKVVN